MLATMSGRARLIGLLLKQEAEVGKKTKRGMTALALGVRCMRPAVFKKFADPAY